ncbi:GNAT family N-acetyltransferase [Paenibacillus puerhi]|uniref:GNAT family N-acetyltransferase n=1 Tax=Paenibacillus puerhi TaxID=2692622 RepID=UPI0013584C5D|nr:GNAT family N-acetyltransferase [Paenibacillus puerhi]
MGETHGETGTNRKQASSGWTGPSEGIQLRSLQLPDDYAAIAHLLNQVWAEPTTAEKLLEDDRKLYEKGKTWIDDNGKLAGYDRERRVAISESGAIVGYVWCWRAPWTEPGILCCTLVVDAAHRRQGIGQRLLEHVAQWADGLGASVLLSEVWDDQPEAMSFARRRGFAVDRHAFQSVLRLDEAAAYNPPHADYARMEELDKDGIRFLTLADAPGEESEAKLYELCRETLVDIPGFLGEVPGMHEWRKWYLMPEGYAPEQVIIAADGGKFVGMTNVLYNPDSNGMYHEYTGVSRAYRGRGLALALKIKAIELAKRRGAAYLRTDNDSTNEPILAINRKLGYKPLRGSYRMMAELGQVLQQLGHAVPPSNSAAASKAEL